MFRYGFELEGFAWSNSEQCITIPPPNWPTDGFPGLLEIRTSGGSYLTDAYFQLLRGLHDLDTKTHGAELTICEYKFSGKDHAAMRRDRNYQKDQLDIKNIYGKEPRALNGRTLASFQINISNLLISSYEKNKVKIPDQYGLLDIHGIVKRLDEEFEKEIKESKRQRGMYAIKDTYRLEYRSLPNFVFLQDAHTLLARIKKAVENG